MSGRPLWNLRLRHESLAQPTKKRHVKRRTRMRNGQQAALERKRGNQDAPEEKG